MTVTAIHPNIAAQAAAPPEAVQVAQAAAAKGSAQATAPPAAVQAAQPAQAAAAKGSAQAPASTSTSTAQQQAALRQLLTRYAYDQ